MRERRKMRRIEKGEDEGERKFHARWMAIGSTDIYDEPIFSFDYSTRTDASRLSRRLHLTVDRGLKFWERKKARRKSEKPGDRSLKNITLFSKTTIFIAARGIDISTAGYVNSSRPRFVITFCKMDREDCHEGGKRGQVVRE